MFWEHLMFVYVHNVYIDVNNWRQKEVRSFIVKRTVIINKDFKMSGHSIFTSLFIFFELYVIATTSNVTSYNVFHGGKINDTDIFNVSIHCPLFEGGYHLP